VICIGRAITLGTFLLAMNTQCGSWLACEGGGIADGDFA
jgi:hypothetical protein